MDEKAAARDAGRLAAVEAQLAQLLARVAKQGREIALLNATIDEMGPVNVRLGNMHGRLDALEAVAHRQNEVVTVSPWTPDVASAYTRGVTMPVAIQSLVRAGTEAVSLAQLAERSHVAVGALQRAQGGDLAGWDVSMVARLSRAIGVDPAVALSGAALPVPKLLAFLREASTGVQPVDTLALRGALSRASAVRAMGLGPRRAYQQRRAPGKDAFAAGYAAARRIRKDLHRESEPLDDLRGVIEEELGVLVVAMELCTPGLEALAIADDAGAAIVLNSRLPRKPVLSRRSIAHELCHLLFDPRDHQAIVDVLSEGESEAPIPEGQRKNREQRARAFAAELLIPSKALKALYPSVCSGTETARRRVMDACEHFGAPWELAVHHLANQRCIEESDGDNLLLEHPNVASSLGAGRPAALEWVRHRVVEGELSEGRARDLFGVDWPDGDGLSS